MFPQPMFFSETADGTLVAPPTCGLVAIPALVSQVTAWCARPGTGGHLVIDLSGTAVVGPEAVRALVWAARYCQSHGRTLGVRPASAGVLTPDEDAVLRGACQVEPAAVVS